MSLICITGHQGTGKSTLLLELRKAGLLAYGIDEENLAGYFNIEANRPSERIPEGMERNLDWRKTNIWRIDMNKVSNLTLPKDKTVYLLGYAVNIEELWNICDDIIIFNLDPQITVRRLTERTNNSFGKHPGEIELALKNRAEIARRAVDYQVTHRVHYVNTDKPIADILFEVTKIGMGSS